MYIPLQVNRFHISILLIVQYKFSKFFSEDFILKNPKKSFCIDYSTFIGGFFVLKRQKSALLK